MPHSPTQDKLNTLLERLRHGSALERADAAEEIGLLKPVVDAAVTALIEALGDDDPDVRYDVAQGLMMMGEAAFPAIPALIRAFTADDDPEVRESAVWALDGIAKDLGGLGPYTTQLVPLLINALHDRSEGMRGGAAGTLGNLVLLNPDEVITALQRVANQDEDMGVRTVAFQAIEKLHNR